MAVNQMQITDIYQILNNLHTQATGRSAIAPVNTSEFVSMATTTLAVGTDKVYNALMETLGRTVFAVRPYDRKFDITMTDDEFGAIKRKISYADKPIQAASQAWVFTDGQSVDQYVINKADPVEMRFYGSAIYQDSITIYQEQLKTAFEGPQQLGEFMTAQMTNMSNKWEQWLEEQNRATVCNFIAAKVAANNGVIHLLTEYNTLTGLSLTAQSVYQPENLADFFRWVRARINTLSRRMTERSGLYQVTVNNKTVNRHTPVEDQRIYLQADALDIIDAMVNTVTFHNEPLAYADVRGVSYWQNINTPSQIQATPASINAAGEVTVGETATMVNNVFGVMFDRDAIGSNRYFYRLANTPLNARGLYYNTWLNARLQYMNDLTEKGLVLLLD
jgi:hypothetical protein